MSKNEIYESTFKNPFGERWTIRINARSRVGVLRGDELGRGQCVRIVDGRLGGGLILADDEIAWLRECWLKATGEELVSPFAALLDVLRPPDSTEGLVAPWPPIEPAPN